MARELRHITITFVVDKPENLGENPFTGEPLYADDVVEIFRSFIAEHADEWYRVYAGQRWLTHEPMVG